MREKSGAATAVTGATTTRDAAAERGPRRGSGRLLVLLGIVVLAFNLRPAAGSVGPVLDEIERGLPLGPTAAGLLTALPVLAFASFGALAPRLARLVGIHRLTLIALLCVAAGIALRSRADHAWSFLAWSMLALAGMAAANVLLPPLVKLHFPDKVGLLTAVYSTALATGMTTASIVTVPVATHTSGGWRTGLLVWSFTALLAAVPWVLLVARDRVAAPGDPEVDQPRIGLGAVARTRLGWAMAGFFGLQSLQAYSIFGWFASIVRDGGHTADQAGLVLGTLNLVGVPLALLVPTLAGRLHDQRPLVWALMVCYPVGYAGLLVAPYGAAWFSAVLIGIGMSTFPLALALIGLRARTSAGTAALSGFTQSVGYLIAFVGPFGVGLLHDLTGGWTVPVIALMVVTVPQLVLGLRLSRPAAVEDELVVAPSAAERPTV